MRTLLRSSVALAGLFALSPLVSSQAHAGGVGIIGAGGLYSGQAHYYNIEGDQGIDNQLRPSTALGIETLLGDSDDKVQGIMRLYASFDSPVNDPDLSNESAPASSFTHPAYASLGTKTTGVMTVGVQWGIIGDPRGFQFGVMTLVGSGFWTDDNLEYFVAEPGAFVSYNVAERIQLLGNLNGQVRFRKSYKVGGSAYAGVRYLFD